MGLLDLLFNTNTDDNKKQKFKVGDKVRVKYRDQEGYIIDINGDLYMVSLKSGEYINSFDASELENINDKF